MEKRCIIITSYLETTIKENVDLLPGDYVICADGGFEFALKENIVPNALIGDFDSYSFSDVENVITSNQEFDHMEIIRTSPIKDDTDTLMCIKFGIKKGFDDFILLGGLGGRLDHTFANIQILSYLLDNKMTGVIKDGNNKAAMIQGKDQINLSSGGSKYFSVYSYTSECTGVYEINSKYTLDNATITQSNPLGTSNEFLDGAVTIKVKEGKLLIIESE